jgi:F0F1-type ATP synthase assembly protein I
MFCPSCGSEENHSNQYCRACGTELRLVRQALERLDNITASAVSARDEIGRAFADKIRETDSAEELKKVAEDVLPEIEKFLESPKEKSLRRMRTGTIISSVGLGVALMFLLMVSNGADAIFMIGLGLITFFIGLGFIINALLFTIPKKQIGENNPSDTEDQIEGINAATNELLMPPIAQQEFSSVTEHTTKHLKKKI